MRSLAMKYYIELQGTCQLVQYLNYINKEYDKDSFFKYLALNRFLRYEKAIKLVNNKELINTKEYLLETLLTFEGSLFDIEDILNYKINGNLKNDIKLEDIIDEIIEYIEICKNKYSYKTFSIHLFGGEPLLQKQELLYLNSKLKEKNISINYYIDTNGILLSEKFIKEFDNITFCVTLSNKCDHDNLRVTSNNTGSYDLIMENLKKIQYVLDNNHRLMVRYNVNDRNINDLEEFLKTIENIKISDFVVAYTNNYKENSFINKLPYKKYKKWNSTKIIPLLEKYNYPV